MKLIEDLEAKSKEIERMKNEEKAKLDEANQKIRDLEIKNDEIPIRYLELLTQKDLEISGLKHDIVNFELESNQTRNEK